MPTFITTLLGLLALLAVAGGAPPDVVWDV